MRKNEEKEHARIVSTDVNQGMDDRDWHGLEKMRFLGSAMVFIIFILEGLWGFGSK